MQTEKVWTLDDVKADWARVKCEVAYVRTIVAAHQLMKILRRQETFNPYHDDAGRFTTADGGITGPGHGLGGAGKPSPTNNDGREQLAQGVRGNPLVPLIIGRRVYEVPPEVARRFEDAASGARQTIDRLRELDPAWKPSASVNSETVEGAQEKYEALQAEAEARLKEILRDAIPNTNPSWGVKRLKKELYDQGYRLVRPTDSPGLEFRIPSTGQEVRIMERPSYRSRTETDQKHDNDYYYRHRKNFDQRPGNHITIPNKPQKD
jgi:hypothetical protein